MVYILIIFQMTPEHENNYHGDGSLNNHSNQVEATPYYHGNQPTIHFQLLEDESCFTELTRNTSASNIHDEVLPEIPLHSHKV